MWISRVRLGETGAAKKELALFLKKRRDAALQDWVLRVAGHLLGHRIEGRAVGCRQIAG